MYFSKPDFFGTLLHIENREGKHPDKTKEDGQ